MDIVNILGHYEVATFTNKWEPEFFERPFNNFAAITTLTPCADSEYNFVGGWFGWESGAMAGLINSASFIRLLFPDSDKVLGPSVSGVFAVIEGTFLEVDFVEYRVNGRLHRDTGLYYQIQGVMNLLSVKDPGSAASSFSSGLDSAATVLDTKIIIFRRKRPPHNVIQRREP